MTDSCFDVLFADIGSTKTMVSAFTGVDQHRPCFVEQGVAATTVDEGDVCIGLERAIFDLKIKIGVPRLKWNIIMATCSAAGGLRMAAHGLVRSMTSKAAKEAALGAGAVVVSDTCGILTEDQIKGIAEFSPKIILLAGGIDGGETEKTLRNARALASGGGAFSVVYAGNKAIRSGIKDIFSASNVPFFVTENVYPNIDQFNIIPARNVIHEIFEQHLVRSPGMKKIKELVHGKVLPTPGAVMLASQILASEIGDLITIDVGGATTDVHSVTRGSYHIREILINPEPDAKRTVEGDLGVYVNAPRVFKLLTEKKGSEAVQQFDFPNPLPLFPKTLQEVSFFRSLTKIAVATALKRHVGRKKKILTYKGLREVALGKDLTEVRWVIGTGGALTRLSAGYEILKQVFGGKSPDLLLPRGKIRFLIDTHYIMPAAGLMGLASVKAALEMMKDSLGIGPGN